MVGNTPSLFVPESRAETRKKEQMDVFLSICSYVSPSPRPFDQTEILQDSGWL